MIEGIRNNNTCDPIEHCNRSFYEMMLILIDKWKMQEKLPAGMVISRKTYEMLLRECESVRLPDSYAADLYGIRIFVDDDVPDNKADLLSAEALEEYIKGKRSEEKT